MGMRKKPEPPMAEAVLLMIMFLIMAAAMTSLK